MKNIISIGSVMLACSSAYAAQTAAPTGPLVIGNNASCGGGEIQTFDFTIGGAPINAFVPDGALPAHDCTLPYDNNGRGVVVLGNKVYYTELTHGAAPPYGFGPSDGIHVAPFNSGAGGHDIPNSTIPNPAPRDGITALDIANGALYAMTGFSSTSSGKLQVWGLSLSTGKIVSGPVTIQPPAVVSSSAFVVLPNGNFLINRAPPGGVDQDGNSLSCKYDQYNPSTGGVIAGTTIDLGTFAAGLPIGGGQTKPACTGVATDGAALYFQVNFTSLVKTDLSGTVMATKPVAGPGPNPAGGVNQGIADVSLVEFGTSGVPGHPNCRGKVTSDLAHQYGGIGMAAAALGYSTIDALKEGISVFCGK